MRARGSQETDLSISLLAENKRTKDWVNFTRSNIFDEELQDQIENAIICVNRVETVGKDIIEGESEKAGPSGVNNNRVAKQKKSNLVKVVIDDKLI